MFHPVRNLTSFLGLAMAVGMTAACGGPDGSNDVGQSVRALDVSVVDSITPKGCTHSKHWYLIYNKYEKDPALNIPWPNTNEAKTLCGMTLYNILWMPDNGDVRVELAHAVIVALNNVNGGASTGGGSGYALQSGLNLLLGSNCGTFTADQLATAANDVAILDSYNAGTIGPGECAESFPGGN
jgi:hypothetical protein